MNYADLDAVERSARAAWRPPPKLTLSQWADEHFRLSAESSAQVGRWVTLPYQKGIMDAFTDPAVTFVSVMKSARVGWTKIINALVGYSIHQDPCPMLVVQPTVEDAQGYSKEEIAPMLRDCPALESIIYEEAEESGPRDSGNTILHKRFPGGVLSLVGANSGAGLRRISRKRVLLDEVDGYPKSAGSDGDPIKLAVKRTEYYWDRKIGMGSTPLIAGHSRIEEEFGRGDQRRYYVPCPHCGHFDHLVFTERDSGGHWMSFDTDAPAGAHFVCSANGCVIEHKHKRDMVTRGEWRSAKPFAGHASFHIWAAYSFSPNATWGQIAAEFLTSRGDRDQLKTFVNTVLGETWKESGEAPEWERLYQRREEYPIGSVPDGVKFLTCGVDVQKDRWVYEVVGWSGREKETWSIEAGAIPGDTSDAAAWVALDELLSRTYHSAAGVAFAIRMMAVDSGYNTNAVYAWCRGHERNRVIAVKGVATQHTLTSPPTPVDVTIRGKRFARGAKVWPVGTSGAKSELYGQLRLQPPLEGGVLPPGFCHFPQYGPEFFRELTAEHLVTTRNKKGYEVHEWQLIPGRQNHQLDCRVYARVAAAVLGVDRMAADARRAVSVIEATGPAVDTSTLIPPRPDKLFGIPAAPVSLPPMPAPRPQINARPLSDSRFLGKRRGGWLKKR